MKPTVRHKIYIIPSFLRLFLLNFFLPFFVCSFMRQHVDKMFQFRKFKPHRQSIKVSKFAYNLDKEFVHIESHYVRCYKLLRLVSRFVVFLVILRWKIVNTELVSTQGIQFQLSIQLQSRTISLSVKEICSQSQCHTQMWFMNVWKFLIYGGAEYGYQTIAIANSHHSS